jgi:hypothetical protein
MRVPWIKGAHGHIRLGLSHFRVSSLDCVGPQSDPGLPRTDVRTLAMEPMNDMTSPLPPMNPTEARLIRLGSSSRWAKTCIDTGTIRYGVSTEPHDACLRGDWDGARDLLLASGMAAREVGHLVRELRDFYTLGPDCLWITLASGGSRDRKLLSQALTLPLRFSAVSESVRHHDSEVMGWREPRSRRRLNYGPRRCGM